MARASTPTILSLDHYAKIMGITPLMFNQSTTVRLLDGSQAFPVQNTQNMVWPQYSWQRFDQVSREELAILISMVETEIESVLGFAVAPRWYESVDIPLPNSYRQEYGYVGENSAGNDVSISVRNKIIAGGRRKLTKLTVTSVIFKDLDNDGWNEVAEVKATVTGTPDVKTIKTYFAGHSGDPIWEIRPAKSKSILAGTVTILFDSWLLFNPSLWEAIATDESPGFVIDAAEPDSYVDDDGVDVYIEANDPTQVSAQFVGTDTNGNEVTTDGFISAINPVLNTVVPLPGAYDLATAAWVRSYDIPSANTVRLWYYAGNKPAPVVISSVDDYLVESLAVAIAYMATARLERPYATNSNASALQDFLRQDWAVTPENMAIRPQFEIFTNPFGTRVGEYKAWLYVNKMMKKRPKAALV